MLIAHGGGWWLFAAFIVAPDLALLAGMSPTLGRGSCIRVPSRSTTPFTATGALRCSHWPAIVLPLGALIGALAWALHISIDRSVGYGMRTRDGFQRS